MNSRYEILFEPLRIGPHTMRNRFYQVPHCANFGVHEPETQARFRATKAEGGWAVVNTEYCSIHPESDDRPRTAAQLWDDNDVRNAAHLCDEVHAFEALAGVELWYGSMHAPNWDSRLAARGVSQSPTAFGEHVTSCYEMDLDEIRQLQYFYRDAALRAKRAGFDIVNVYGGQAAAIPQQFLDSTYNRRTDLYGGSLENRARFWLEVLELVRTAVGDTCAISTRIGYQRGGEVGLSADEACAFVGMADHLVDVWELTVSNVVEWGEDVGPSRSHVENFQSDWAWRVRNHTQKPLVGVGRFVNPDVMVDVITSGQQDAIGAARPSIADPFLPEKIRTNRVEDVRECIGCNICISRVWGVGSRLICTQNPTIGEEFRRGWHPEDVEPSGMTESGVLVVGAGPAGLECAMVLGKRGVGAVHVVEAEEDMGGCMRWIPSLPGLGEWRRVVDYRRFQIDKLRNVQFIPRTRLSAAEVLNYGANVVVVAAGASWSKSGLNPVTRRPIDGADAELEWQYTPDQIMAQGKQVNEDRILIYDTDGYFTASSLAEKLARQGKTVTLMTSFERFAPYLHHTGEYFQVARTLNELGVDVITNFAVTQIHRGDIKAAHTIFPDHARQLEHDGVILVTQRESDTALWRDLLARKTTFAENDIAGVYRIGDCVVPRHVSEAIFDGHRLAREIDSDDPASPRPHFRENRVLA